MHRALALSVLALALGANSAQAGDPIRVGYIGTSLASIPIVVADGKGFFAAQGLDAKLMPFESSQPVALAIASGAGSEALRYFIAQRYVDAVGQLAANPTGRTLVVPLETGGLAGGVASALAAMQMGTAEARPPTA